MYKKGKLIVIEGSDGTGKETQSNFLLKNINDSGLLGANKAHLISFPDYESPAGKKVRAYLNGELGNVEEVPAMQAALLYAEDRRDKKQEMEDILNRGDWIIADRYLQSNMAYQGAKIRRHEARQYFYRELLDLEYRGFGVPRPDLVAMLQLDGVIAQKHLNAREQFDIHEQDLGYLDKVRQEYERLSVNYYQLPIFAEWKTISCSREGQQLARKEISGIVWKIVLDHFFKDKENERLV